MQFGVVYPQTDLPTDSNSIRTYVRRVEELGYQHILAFEHVVGADPAVYPNWHGPYDLTSTFHEPFVLYGFLAGLTSLELVTAVIAAPQRQTVLLAKQAAEVDILAAGRFRLGLGVGWNPVEYAALGQEFATRGDREEEQVELLRRLWTERSVTHVGRFDQVHGAGLAPLPVQRPIPIWLGGQAPATYRRIGRIADGWFPVMQPGPQLAEAQMIINEGANEIGRDLALLGMEGRIRLAPGQTDNLYDRAKTWEAAGATHLSVDTMKLGLVDINDHLICLTDAAEALHLGH